MEWTDVVVLLPAQRADDAVELVSSLSAGGVYVEDYTDLEEQVNAIAHIDLIEQDLLDKPRDEVKIHTYLSPEENVAAFIETLRGALLAAGLPGNVSISGVKQEDWETSWKQYYHPIEIGRRLAVSPSWEAYQSGRVTLRLDPGMAFGTGTHETTFLCLEVLEERVRGGEQVLDIGTGSGILGVAALLLGAGQALGIDIDPMAVRTATENAERNGVQERFSAKAGDLAGCADGPYNMITANIVAAAICRLAPDIPALLASGGIFIASGIIDEREEEVSAALQNAGLHLSEVRRKNGWVAMICTLAPV